MKPLKPGDILRNIGQMPFARGKAYFEQGRVISFNAELDPDEPDLIKINSSVKGSGIHTYEQQIEIDREDGYIDINGYCSCPVRFNCKHVVAACLQHSKNTTHTEYSSGACFKWLDSFSATTHNTADQPNANEEFLIYQLSASRHIGKIGVEFFATRILKNGNLGKGRAVNLGNINESHQATRHTKQVDLEIAKLLRANDNYHWHDVLIQGELGFLALTKMMQTGRCFWEHAGNVPLNLGAERELDLDWQQDKQGNSKLNINVNGGGLALLTEPPLYLDPNAAQIGPLATATYSARQLEQLLNAPTIPAKAVAEFSQQLARVVPRAVLPPPKKIDMEEISGQAPVPHLQLSGREDNGHAFHLMRLRFAYGDHIITTLPEADSCCLTINEKIIQIWRDIDAEYEAIEQLEAFGFEGMMDSNQKDLIFLSLNQDNPMEAAARWHTFLTKQLPQLEQQGWQIEQHDSFGLEFHQASQWNAEIEEQGNDWFGLRFDIEINEQPLALLPLVSQVLAHYELDNLPETLTLHLGGTQYLSLPSEQIKPILETLYELYDSSSLQDDGSLRLSRFDAGRLDDLESTTDLQWRGGEALRELGKKLKNFQGIETAPLPQGLSATLRDYQQQGLNWLQFLREYRFGGVLADDMGLGKTVQTLAHLLIEKEQGRMDKPCLIIAPTSLMSNWRREAEQFTPALKVLILQGAERHQRFEQIAEHDLILSTYPLLSRDEDKLLAHDYHVLVLDEAQVIKNPRAKAAQVVRNINANQRLCLTGTPMENHLGELWALFDFLMPGFLGDARQFTTLFRTPIEKHGDSERGQRLSERVAPFMLRRTKDEVATELPEKTEIICNVIFDKKQAALYESIRLSMEAKVQQSIAKKGLARSHIIVLDALLKLRQVCCDPRLLALTQARAVKESAKLELLMQMLPEMVEEGRRILLFSQFTKMLGHIETELKKENISYTKLTGQTRKRDDAIEEFKSGQASVFLISLKAGGVGLNLTEADTVIHYDPWWNPAAENQATDRAHRIGQNKAVFVYKLVTENSVEEKIIAMQERKQALAQGVYGKGKQDKELKLTTEDMQKLFAPLE